MKALTVSPPDPWWTGENRAADEALDAALAALKEGHATQCLAAIQLAMERYGWRYHSDRQARNLWSRWEQLAEFARRDPAAFSRAEGPLNYVDLFHEVSRSVRLARDKRIRRNLPP
jgi:hypothetical protein